MKRPSITARIILFIFVAEFVMGAAIVTAAVLYAREELRKSFDTALTGKAASILALVQTPESDGGELSFNYQQAPSFPEDRYQVFDPQGRLLASSPSWSGKNLLAGAPPESYWDFEEGQRDYRALVLRNISILDLEPELRGPAPRVTVIYAAPTARLEAQIHEIGLAIGLASLVVFAFSAAAVFWAVRKGMLPLRELAQSAARIDARRWEFAPPPEVRATRELAPLAQALQTLVGNLKSSFDREREFVANAAHELKTAVAIQKSTLQALAQRVRTIAEYQGGIERALEDTDRAELLVARMLQLAGLEQEALREAGRGESADLVESFRAALDQLGPLAAERGVRIRLQAEKNALVPARPGELRLLWQNLLENAIQHSAAGTEVVLSVSEHSPGHCLVTVTDQGAGIPPADLPHIFERFYRADQSRSRETGGFGLGLAICKAIVEKAGGLIQIKSRLGKGTSVFVGLPAANLVPSEKAAKS